MLYLLYTAQTNTKFGAINLFETKKENEFQQTKLRIKVNKTIVTGSSQHLGGRQRRSSIAGHPSGVEPCEFTQVHISSPKQLENNWLVCGIRQAQMP